MHFWKQEKRRKQTGNKLPTDICLHLRKTIYDNYHVGCEVLYVLVVLKSQRKYEIFCFNRTFKTFRRLLFVFNMNVFDLRVSFEYWWLFFTKQAVALPERRTKSALKLLYWQGLNISLHKSILTWFWCPTYVMLGLYIGAYIFFLIFVYTFTSLRILMTLVSVSITWFTNHLKLVFWWINSFCVRCLCFHHNNILFVNCPVAKHFGILCRNSKKFSLFFVQFSISINIYHLLHNLT